MKIKFLLGIIFLPTLIQAAHADLKQQPALQHRVATALSQPSSQHQVVIKSRALKPTVKTENVLLNKQKVVLPNNTLRCWQDGKLIVAEHQWRVAFDSHPLLINQQSKKIYTFDYGETFCIFLGD